ncbi:hypothetical protein ANN_14815 [Periplaneta americana]|uniref:S-adenosylmethionine sensor upstream of mTORC1 n=1 Tax=Periplaneta americana TaxID=6978 RepID=A0ABQ8SYV3_PERAM|nr:hypothetical protein ANN_14815 [Periplaneta americana]
MATEEQQQLSAFVKKVHHMLRSEARKVGVNEAWKEHCSKSDILQEYAVSMQKLASEFWEQNAEDGSKSAQSRIKWVVQKCVHYFYEGEREKRRNKEKERIKKIECSENFVEGCAESVKDLVSLSEHLQTETEQLKLLDVGSCYNPFKIYPIFKVVPVDLAPALPDVYICDFLNLNVVENAKEMELRGTCIRELPSNAFDVVVFSLLLEYFPCPKQRYLCVCKAYDLLKVEGLLFIVTPDSKHSTANAPLMKSWRIVLAELGFSRIYYEKLPHIHCMTFRKDINPEITKQWASYELSKQGKVQSNSELNIPQDFQEILDECSGEMETKNARTNYDDENLAQMFSHLPCDPE